MAVGLTSTYDGEGQNNWFLFYLGIREWCVSVSLTIFTPSLWYDCGPHQATCYDFYPPWPKSYELVPTWPGRAGGNYGERRAPTLHRANMLHSLHIINKQSLGCQMLQYWIWISWPSTTRRLLNCFLRILSNGPTFSCENSWVLFAMSWDMTIREQQFGV